MGSQRQARRKIAPAVHPDKPRAPKRAARDPEGTRNAILDAAIREFALEGYGGGRIDRISTAARSNDRMVYYYFGSKQDLFRESIERVYASLVEAEQKLVLDFTNPIKALEDVIEFNWRYYIDHPEFISLINTENLFKAHHIKQSEKTKAYSLPQLEIINQIIDQGRARRLFCSDVDAESVFLTVASLTYFYHSNVHTLSNYLGRDLLQSDALDGWLSHVKGVVVASLRTPLPRR